jgi:hypothetical protein
MSTGYPLPARAYRYLGLEGSDLDEAPKHPPFGCQVRCGSQARRRWQRAYSACHGSMHDRKVETRQ